MTGGAHSENENSVDIFDEQYNIIMLEVETVVTLCLRLSRNVSLRRGEIANPNGDTILRAKIWSCNRICD